MIHRLLYWLAFLTPVSILAAPVIDPIGNASIPAGKTLIVPVTASSPNGRPLSFTATSSTNRITVEVQTNNPFWKMSVVQAAPANAPGAYQTPFRGGLVTVTNVGDMTFMLFPRWAPHTVDVIRALTDSGFYSSNTIFHRVVSAFVIQGGDPLTNGMGGPVFRYDDEFHPRALFSGNGQLALANSGKDTDGSQFFVTVGPQRFLDFGYTLFGQLVRGFDVLSYINNTPTNSASRPLADVIITRASRVPDPTDTVLVLSGTDVAGVSGSIKVVADDGLGGRATNTFTATTVADANNDPPFLYPGTVTNLIVPLNGRVTNTVSVLDLEGNTPSWSVGFSDTASSLAATNSTFNTSNGQLVVIPNKGYSGPISLYAAVAPNSSFATYDYQTYTFAAGDTAISARGTNFAADPLEPLANRILAWFTNGIPDSATGNFTASINWGDNTTNLATIATGSGGWKEVSGSHAYSYGGDYPVYVTIRSSLGASATVVSTIHVRPSLDFVRSGGDFVIRWPAWAADYRLQSAVGQAGAAWTDSTNLSRVVGYDTVATNRAQQGSVLFRLHSHG